VLTCRAAPSERILRCGAHAVGAGGELLVVEAAGEAQAVRAGVSVWVKEPTVTYRYRGRQRRRRVRHRRLRHRRHVRRQTQSGRLSPPLLDQTAITDLLQDAASNGGVGLRTVFPPLWTKRPVRSARGRRCLAWACARGSSSNGRNGLRATIRFAMRLRPLRTRCTRLATVRCRLSSLLATARVAS